MSMARLSRPPDLALSRVPRSKLAETVAEHLLAEIRGKDLAPGTRMPSERELMGALGVGRSTVREAINGLAMLGVLEIRHGQGAFVAEADPEREVPRAIAAALARGVTRDLFEARMLVEPAVARLAAERRTEGDLRVIERALTDHEQALSTGAPAVAAAVSFHVSIGEAAHSEVLAGFLNAFHDPLTERGPVLEAAPGYREWELDQHRFVFEPIRAGVPERAATNMQRHLVAVVRHHERIGLQ